MGEKKPALKRPRIGNEADESAAQPRDLNQDVGSSHTVSLAPPFKRVKICGEAYTPLQGFSAGSGQAQESETWYG